MTTALGDRMDLGRDDPISVQDFRDRGKLFTLEEARNVLSSTEPLSYVPFTPGAGVRFRVEPDWQDGISQLHGTSPIGVHMRMAPSGDLSGPDVSEHQLSKDALLSACKPFGMNGNYALRCPGHLLEANLNYWYRDGLERELQLMTAGPEAVGQAVTRGSVTSFSNLALLNAAMEAIGQRYPADSVYVDAAKLTHSLRRTFLQLVIPAETRQMVSAEQNRSGVDDDWWAGLSIKNGQTAELQTSVSGYFYRPICTNGMIDSGPTAGTWSRRSGGQDADDVYAWAEHAVEEVLGGFERTFDQVQATTEHRLDGEIGDMVADVFEQFRLPARARSRVVDSLVEDDQLTVYSVLNAVTEAANDADRPEEAMSLMETGGDLAEHHDRCDNCHRLLQ